MSRIQFRRGPGILLAAGVALATAVPLAVEYKKAEYKMTDQKNAEPKKVDRTNAQQTNASDDQKEGKKYEVEFRPDVVFGTGAGEDLTLDLALPKGTHAAAPGLVFIHGGGWQSGNKDDFAAQAKEAAAAGYLAVSINYRLAPKHLFPAQVEDCKCAVRWMRAHAAELKLDRDRIGAFGWSSGGHLALLLGVTDTSDGLEGDGGSNDQSSKVQAVVSYVGATHLIGDFSTESVNILKNFLGGPMDENRELYLQASPIKYVNAGDPPMLLFAGTNDPLVQYDQAFQMATALSDAGVPGRVEFLLGAGHVFSPLEMKRTMLEAMEFFDDTLGAGRDRDQFSTNDAS
ncbi:MAG TPA: alpha/beta hydrolase [Pirellulales bacterium]|nr:alpha/beta hydrolase [Pirellulales bacterium]